MKSNLEQLYTKKAEYIEVAGRNIVKTFGDVENEYKALREGAMIYDCCKYGLFEISGANSACFLERLSTKDIQYLNVGNICECYFLDDDVSVVGSVYIYRKDDAFLVISPWEHAELVKDWMLLKKDGEVDIVDLSGERTIISVEGPKSWKLLKQVFNSEIETLALRYADEILFHNDTVEMIRIGRTSEYGYLLITNNECGQYLYETLVTEKIDYPVSEGGLQAIELAMLEVHLPNFRKETRDFGNIFELCQQWYIQYEKEDYIGFKKLREMLDLEIKKGAVGFICDNNSNLLDSKSQVLIDNECIGEVIYSMYSYRMKSTVGIAVVDTPFNQSGLEFQVKTGGDIKVIRTISAPFVRPLSWDMKME